jgi:hypothetical protein
MTTITAFTLINGQNTIYMDRNDGASLTIDIPYTVSNKSSNTLYYALSTSNGLYNITLGTFTVSAGNAISNFFTATRVNPGTDVVETVPIILKIYSDYYTTLISTLTITLTFNIADLESWTYNYYQDFSTDITGWSGQTGVTGAIAATGTSSLYWTGTSIPSNPSTVNFTRSGLTLPSYNKVVLSYYTLGNISRTSGATTVTVYEQGIVSYVNGVLVSSELNTSGYITATANSATIVYETNWIKHTLDLSKYSGQTITLMLANTQSYSGTSTGPSQMFLEGFKIYASN